MDTGITHTETALRTMIATAVEQHHYADAADLLQQLVSVVPESERYGCWTDIQRARYLAGDIPAALAAAETRLSMREFDDVGWIQEYSNYHRYLGLHDRAREITSEIPDQGIRLRDLSWHEFRWGDIRSAFEMQEQGRDDWGWSLHEPPVGLTRWRGERCTNLVILGEAGAGDQILYSRWIPDLQQRCEHVWYLGDGNISAALSRVFDLTPVSDISILSRPGMCAVPMLSVPYELGVSEIQSRAYLSPDPMWSRFYDMDIPKSSRPRIGICWSGRKDHTENHLRSVDPQALYHCVEHLGDIINLQYQSEPVPGAINPRIEFWEQTLALIHSCDAVVSVDTAVAHAAAALGIPTVVAVNRACYYCWPMGTHAESSSWYPNAWSVAQTQVQRWDDVLEKIKSCVAALLARRIDE
jgi:hypothetical protein